MAGINDPLAPLVERVAGLQAKVDSGVVLRRGYITRATPLTLQLDGQDSPLAGSPETLVGGLSAGDRVLVSMQHRRVVVLGMLSDVPFTPQDNVLWSGGWYMHATQVAELSRRVSEQNTGIVLVWQGYSSSAPQRYDVQYTFVPKWHVAALDGAGLQCTLWAGTSASAPYQKYVYVSDREVKGNAINGVAPRTHHVLTAVLGV